MGMTENKGEASLCLGFAFLYQLPYSFADDDHTQPAKSEREKVSSVPEESVLTF